MKYLDARRKINKRKWMLNISLKSKQKREGIIRNAGWLVDEEKERAREISCCFI